VLAAMTMVFWPEMPRKIDEPGIGP